MEILLFALNAVLPILALIGLGYILKRIGFLTEEFLRVGNKFVFRIGLPAYLYFTIYSISSLTVINWSVIVYAVMAILILFIVGLLIANLLIPDKRQKGVIIQAIFRSNYAIIGIPLAQALGGADALAVVALISAIAVPLMNVLAVISLSIFIKEDNAKLEMKETLIRIAKNPLIIGVLLGLFTLLIRSFIPVDALTHIPVFTIQYNLIFIYTSIRWVGQIASPFALIILGGTFEFFVIKSLWKQIIIGTLSRVMLAPLITLSLAVFLSYKTSFFHFTVTDYPAFIALLASPTAVSSAIMAKEMQNDEVLAIQLVVWSTISSILSIFIIIIIFRATGLL